MKKALLTTAVFSITTLMLTLPAASALTVTDMYSLNWSGYVAYAPTPFTSVSATWTIPEVTGSTTAYSAIWTGIGGWYRNSNKLIQAGSEQDITSATEQYSVWYEIFPQFPVTVATVAPGDTVAVSISENTGKPNTWHITITVNSNTKLNSDFKVNTNFAAEATAEWIVERPLLVVGHQIAPLADFVTTTFSSCTASGTGLSALTEAYKVTMTSDGTSTGTALATPTSLSGNSFTVNT